jgi:hypothetical protein
MEKLKKVKTYKVVFNDGEGIKIKILKLIESSNGLVEFENEFGRSEFINTNRIIRMEGVE